MSPLPFLFGGPSPSVPTTAPAKRPLLSLRLSRLSSSCGTISSPCPGPQGADGPHCYWSWSASPTPFIPRTKQNSWRKPRPHPLDGSHAHTPGRSPAHTSGNELRPHPWKGSTEPWGLSSVSFQAIDRSRNQELRACGRGQRADRRPLRLF